LKERGVNVTVEHEKGRVPVTVLKVHGDVDASSYQALIAAAREQVAAGARHMLLDLSEVPYVGSSGLVALHRVALLVRGQQPPDPEGGWRAFHELSHDVEQGRQQAVKLLSPLPAVARVLATSGMDQFFEIYADRAEALRAFAAATGP
jgi:anti-anti-sigma factor